MHLAGGNGCSAVITLCRLKLVLARVVAVVERFTGLGMNTKFDPTDEDTRRAHFSSSADRLREEMEALSLKVRDLIIPQPPIQLLGYLLAQFHMDIMSAPEEERRSNNVVIQKFQLALEYVHAVWSCHSPLTEEAVRLNEASASELFDVFDRLAATTMMYCMASSAMSATSDGGRQSADTEFHAKSAWSLIRGHRYQVLEGEFFRYVLRPHADALQEAYGMQFDAIADGIQNIADAFRAGFAHATEQMFERMEQVFKLIDETGEDLEKIIAGLKESEPTYAAEMSGYMHDIFFGGVCNLSRHSSMSEQILEDLSFQPGENKKFYAEGEFVGTPMRTLPAREKPGIKLGDQFYATDGQFIRDSAYRAIQWGLWKRLPYREEWLKRQAQIVEQAYPAICANQLRGARTYNSVYYRDPQTGDWAETDLLIVLEDVLFIVEAKAGAMPMQSPATNFSSHERVIQDLIVKAYRQCRRFLEYLASQAEVSIFHLVAGEYIEIARLRHTVFRKIFPIGLTVEAFTPFSAMAKELAEVQPIIDRYPFISMSVDDLFVLNRFLPTTGSLVHYLDVRQQVAGMPRALIFDEIDHLGAYISRNRFDQDIRKQLEKADQVAWDSFSEIVDQHFEGPDWDTNPVPSQSFPEPLERLLQALDRIRPAGWLAVDACLRDYDGETRDNLARFIDQLEQTLIQQPRRRFQFGDNAPLQLWLCRQGEFPSRQEMQYQAEVACLVVGSRKMDVLLVGYEAIGQISGLACISFPAPSLLRRDFGTLQAEAERQRGRKLKFSQDRSGRPARG